MDDATKLSLEAIGRFMAASEAVRFDAEGRQQLDDWVDGAGNGYKPSGQRPIDRPIDPALKSC
jgi:hypothetical protein